MKSRILTVALALTACSNAPQSKAELSTERSRQAMSTASNYAVAHFGAPSCRDPNPNWRYRVYRDNNVLVADIGPKQSPSSHIRILMRASDLAIIKAFRT